MAKRFYKDVSVQKVDGGFSIMLDGRVLKTPDKIAIICPKCHQAELVAGEWRAQNDEINPQSMPCTRLINVACSQTPARRDALEKEFIKYARTDLLCYRAFHPEELVSRQRKSWQPILKWADQKLSIKLETTTGIQTIAQDKASLEKAGKLAAELDDLSLTLLLHLTATFGSAILALAVMRKRLGVETAFALSRLDEIYQNENWGEDSEAIDKAAHLLAELKALQHLIG